MMVCGALFPKGSRPYQKDDGFYMHDLTKMQLDYYIKNITDDWEFTIIISGSGGVRVGKCLNPEATTLKTIKDGKIIDRKLSEFKDGEKVKTLSWDFNNNKEVVSESEIIVEDDEKEFFEVELENGEKVVCTKDHKLFVKRKFAGTDDKKEWKIIELKLKDIKEGDEIVCL